ncbi:MAG TPA: hypothetical protein DHV86_06790 [Methylophilaceae bacterium]|nr:hypothetical protein [Methylophilaceae bacterium]
MSKCKYCKKELIVPLHIQKGFHISCKQKKDRDDMEDAKKNIAAKKAPNARFVQGGAPGLVQQARVGRAGGGGTRPPGTGIKKEIKDGCKLFKVDLVIMQIGAYYKLIEEDANYMHEEFGLNYTNTGEDIDVVGFPRHDLKNKKRQLLQKDICFCIVDEVAPSNGRFIREVVFANCDPAVMGLTFVGGPTP